LLLRVVVVVVQAVQVKPIIKLQADKAVVLLAKLD
jgi:hypothetical protein